LYFATKSIFREIGSTNLMDLVDRQVAGSAGVPRGFKHLAMAPGLPNLGQEVPMKTTTWNLIVMAPHSPRLEKIRVSVQAGLILVAAFVLAFLTTVFLLLMFPQARVNESDRARLAAENQAMQTENKNIAIRIGKLDAQVSKVEAHSQRVVSLAQTD
jgi:hypothetical protein